MGAGNPVGSRFPAGGETPARITCTADNFLSFSIGDMLIRSSLPSIRQIPSSIGIGLPPLRQVRLDRLELLQRRPRVLHDLRLDHVGVRELLRLLQALVLEPEDVESSLVALDDLVVGERTPASKAIRDEF